MQIVSYNLHEISSPVFWKKKYENYFKMSSAGIFYPACLA